MLVKAILDNLGYVEALVQTGTAEDDIEVNLDEIELDYLYCYKVGFNETTSSKVLVLDVEKKATIINNEKEGIHENKINEQTRSLAEMFIASGENSTDFMERIDAQVLYSALMTDTLIESEVEVNE